MKICKMKKIIYSIILLIFSQISLGQSLRNENGDDILNNNNSEQNDDDDTETTQTDSVKAHYRHTWTWQHKGVYKKNILVDTSYNHYHNYNYIFKENISNTYLGNNPSPYESNIFMERHEDEDFMYLNNLRAYLVKPNDIPHFNTTTPFTQLRFFSGGSKGHAEQVLDVFHTQNVKPWWNAGFRYNIVKGDGRYENQGANAYNFSVFTNYEKERNVVSLFLNQNNGKFEENGGIKERAYITDTTTYDAQNMPILLNGNGVENKYRNLNLNLQVQHSIGRPSITIKKYNPDTIIHISAQEVYLNAKATKLLKDSLSNTADTTLNTVNTEKDNIASPNNLKEQAPIDSLANISEKADTIYNYALKAVIDINIEDNERKYSEASANKEYFLNTYADTIFNSDHIANRIYDISAKLVLNEHPKFTYFPQAYIGAGYKQEIYNHRIAYDTTMLSGQRGKDNIRNMYLNAGIFSVDTNAVINYDLNARLALIGDYIGDFKIDGYISKSLKKDWSSYLQAEADISLTHPNIFYNKYFGRHDIWQNDFSAIKKIDIRGKYINTKTRTELGIGINNRFNHIYFDTLARPQQMNKTLITATAWAKQIFKAGNFYFDQKVYFQTNTEEDIISLPMIAVYSHNYYKNELFNKALGLVVGVDLFYTTAFYSDNYMPSTMMFHQQRTYKAGNYPKFDIFGDFEIQRAVIFVRYEHINHLINKAGNYFSASNYPINPSMFEFGIRWNFFD